MRYLGVYILNTRAFSCCFDYAKRGYYRSLNAIFGKVGRIASEEVVLQLITSKCLPILLYGNEACRITLHDKRSLDFAVNRFLMKLFKTGQLHIVHECSQFFKFDLPSTLINRRTERFLRKYNASNNSICKLYA